MPQGGGSKSKSRRSVRGVPNAIERAVLRTLRACRVEPPKNFAVEQPRPRLRTAAHRQIAPPDSLFRGGENVKMAYLPYVTTVGTARAVEEVGISLIRVSALPGADANLGIKFKLSSSKTYRCGRGTSEITSLVVRHASQDSEIPSRQVYSLRFYHEDGFDGCLVLRLNEGFRKRMVLASAAELPALHEAIPRTVCNRVLSPADRTPKELAIINFLLGDEGVQAATRPDAAPPTLSARPAPTRDAAAPGPALRGRRVSIASVAEAAAAAESAASPSPRPAAVPLAAADGGRDARAGHPHLRGIETEAAMRMRGPGRRPGTRAHSRLRDGGASDAVGPDATAPAPPAPRVDLTVAAAAAAAAAAAPPSRKRSRAQAAGAAGGGGAGSESPRPPLGLPAPARTRAAPEADPGPRGDCGDRAAQDDGSRLPSDLLIKYAVPLASRGRPGAHGGRGTGQARGNGGGAHSASTSVASASSTVPDDNQAPPPLGPATRRPRSLLPSSGPRFPSVPAEMALPLPSSGGLPSPVVLALPEA